MKPEALVWCRHCGAPIAATTFGWRHVAGLVGCVFDDGFLSTTAAPAPRQLADALARDDVVLASYADEHHVALAPPENVTPAP